MNRFILLFLLFSLLTVALFVVACGDDDDDDGDIYRPGQGGDDDDNGDDDAGSADCLTFAEDFYGPEGCVPDDDAYQAMTALCAELDGSDSATVEDYFACLAAIDCAQYEEPLDLYEATAACAQEIID